jgi:hypothetical protein
MKGWTPNLDQAEQKALRGSHVRFASAERDYRDELVRKRRDIIGSVDRKAFLRRTRRRSTKNVFFLAPVRKDSERAATASSKNSCARIDALLRAEEFVRAIAYADSGVLPLMQPAPMQSLCAMRNLGQHSYLD